MSNESTEKAASPDRAEYHSALNGGLMIGRYRIVSVLGEGGFGITYSCTDTQLHRDVAIKEYLPSGLAIRQGGTEVLPRSTETSKDFVWGRSRFLDEARTMAKLSRVPAVVRVHDFLEAHGTAYVVMELLHGETLQQRLEKQKYLSQAEIDRILPPLLEGLEQIHSVGFLHRDIKPANIILGPDDQPTLIDFGASRAAVAGRSELMTAVFTPGFAAPEQSSTGRQGPWTDIYGLAATLYACVTGGPPPSAMERLLDTDAPLSFEAAVGDYAPNLMAAINAGMLLQPNMRPQSIEAWREVLATGVMSLPDAAPRGTERAAQATQFMPRPEAAVPELEQAAAAVDPPKAEPVAASVTAPSKSAVSKSMLLAGGVAAVLLLVGGAGWWVMSERAAAEAKAQAAIVAAQQAAAAEATRQKEEAERRIAEAQRQAEEAAARARAQAAEAKAAADAKAAEEQARTNAEPNEVALKLTNRDRAKLQVALLAAGFDVGGIDGTFGKRSRETIAAWQTKIGDVPTGYFTETQKNLLFTEGAQPIARWEEQQRRAAVAAEEQRRQELLRQQTPPPPPPKRGFKWPWE
ncbi:MAG: hypothetical protein EPO67_03555 [Reyranella sp.]|nr:MAG: hypothetical protein EPO67_03555 [Reyranella sp.]